MESELNDFNYKERMLHLTLNTDETFELRWVDYYSESGFDAILRKEHLKPKQEGKPLTSGEQEDDQESLPDLD